MIEYERMKTRRGRFVDIRAIRDPQNRPALQVRLPGAEEWVTLTAEDGRNIDDVINEIDGAA